MADDHAEPGEPKKSYKIAHNLNDPNKIRSKDVQLSQDLTFDHLHLSPKTLLGLKTCGFQRPSPVQLDTIPLGRCGFDLIVQSKAGTGKTCIFSLVALEALNFNPNRRTQTIVLSPTREIAIQSHQVLTALGCAYEHFECALCIGGVGVKNDRAALTHKDGSTCQVVVGTPGRIKQLIELNILKVSCLELFVMDEADKLMEDQFKTQIDEIIKHLPDDKQVIVTSATYPNELASFLERYMRSPKFIKVGKEISLEAVEEFYVESKAGQSQKITIYNKFATLKKLLLSLDFAKGFVFTNYQTRAPLICDYLNSDDSFQDRFGVTNYICAELSQDDRNVVFKKFKNSDQRVLISTDISARGIDIHDIEIVINFDLPSDNSTYYHRIGRAGRFGQPGKAISIVSGAPVDQSVFDLHIRSAKIQALKLE